MLCLYSMFNKDLTCTLGKGKYQYKPGDWIEEPEANCVKNGFHCAKNPLDCLSYYSSWDNSQCWIVEIGGDIDEDRSGTSGLGYLERHTECICELLDVLDDLAAA